MPYFEASSHDEKKRSSKHPFVILAQRCPLSNSDAVTSSFTTPRTLFFIRLLFATYCSVTLLADIVLAAWLKGGTNFKYFTNITFTGLTIYFILSAIHSYQFVKRNSTPTYNAVYRWIYWHLFATNICYHVIVPLIFWTMLRYDVAKYDAAALWTSITMHGGDFVMMAIDLVLCNTLLSWIQLPVVILFALLYLILAVVVHAVDGTWVYSFLDASKNPVVTAITIPGIALLCVLLFAGGRSVCKWRKTNVEIIERPIEVPVNTFFMTQCIVDTQSGYNITVDKKGDLDIHEFPIDRKDATLGKSRGQMHSAA